MECKSNEKTWEKWLPLTIAWSSLDDENDDMSLQGRLNEIKDFRREFQSKGEGVPQSLAEESCAL